MAATAVSPRPALPLRTRLLGFLTALAGLAGPLLSPGSAWAQLGSAEIRGRAPQVIDSALLDFGGQPVYLYGLRGATPDETCALGGSAPGATWACGQEARWAARNRIAQHWVDCRIRARGARGEVFAVCYLGGIGGPELNAWLVAQGWARAARDYAADYVAAEDAARAARLGLWRGR
jgi:endonuclease YncB( thermonuclease family)